MNRDQKYKLLEQVEKPLYLLFLIVGIPAIIFGLFRNIDQILSLPSILQISALILLITLFFTRRLLPYNIRILLPVLAGTTIGFAGLLSFGLLANGLVVIVLMLVIYGVIISDKSYMLLFGFTSIVLMAIAYQFINGSIKLEIELNKFMSSPVIWADAFFTFAASGIMVYTVLGVLKSILDNQSNELEDEKEKSRLLLNNLEQVVIKSDKEGRIRFVNKRIKEYGYEIHQVIGSQILDFAHPVYKDKIFEEIINVINHKEYKSKEIIAEFRVYNEERKQSYKKFSMRIHRIYDDDQFLEALQFNFSESKQNVVIKEESPKNNDIDLVSAYFQSDYYKMILNFIDSISIESDRILKEQYSIFGKLKEFLSGDKAKQAFVSDASNYSENLNELMGMTLNVGLPNSTNEEINFDLFLKDYMKDYREKIPVNINVDYKYVLTNSKVLATKVGLSTIFNEIFKNSIEAFSKQNGQIVITYKKYNSGTSNIKIHDAGSSYLELDISDNGPGIDPKLIPKLVYPHFTLKNSESHKGLGLTKIVNILNSSDSKLFIDSKSGDGFNVKILLKIF